MLRTVLLIPLRRSLSSGDHHALSYQTQPSAPRTRLGSVQEGTGQPYPALPAAFRGSGNHAQLISRFPRPRPHLPPRPGGSRRTGGRPRAGRASARNRSGAAPGRRAFRGRGCADQAWTPRAAKHLRRGELSTGQVGRDVVGDRVMPRVELRGGLAAHAPPAARASPRATTFPRRGTPRRLRPKAGPRSARSC